MTIDEFATVTQRVIAADGLDGLLPTACYPERGELAAQEGLPPDVDPEPAVLKMGRQEGPKG